LPYRDAGGSSDAPAESDDLADLIDTLAPGRNDLVALIQAYFDESISGDYLCVAGYVFTKGKVKHLDAEWRKMLRQYRLPYFRMSACAHGNSPFDKLSPANRDKVARKAIALICEFAALGIAATVNQRQYEENVPNPYGFQGPYEFCAWNCLMGVRRWIEEEGRKGDVAYVFEAGHASQSKANRLMQQLFESDKLRARYRYVSHTFVDKVKVRPVQTADVIAWQWLKDRKNEAEGRPRRKDLEALLSVRHLYRHIDVDQHAEVTRQILAEASGEQSP